MDEVDRLLDDSFADDLEEILNVLPKTRQTLLYTATMTPEISSLEFASEKKPFVYACAERYVPLSAALFCFFFEKILKNKEFEKIM
jgi:superfamily II DNA/RNA helicase